MSINKVYFEGFYLNYRLNGLEDKNITASELLEKLNEWEKEASEAHAALVEIDPKKRNYSWR